MSIFSWVLIGFLILSSVGSIYMIGKPREPRTVGDAAANVLINSLIIVALVVWG